MGIGLSPIDAYQVHAEFGVKLFGFALLVDYRTPGESPVPADWLGSQADLNVPHLLAEAVGVTKPTPDEFFDHLVDTLILAIKACGPQTG